MFALLKRYALPSLVVLAVLAFFHRALFGERLYAVDFFQTFVPLRAILADAWTHGMPVWSGRLGNGGPVLANPAYAALYAPNLVLLGTDPAHSMTLLTVAHFAFGALGAWTLARRWAISSAGAWTAAVVFALGGPALASSAYPNLCWPLAWLPWSLVAQDQASGRRPWLGAIALAVVWASMLSMGDPFVLVAAFMGGALVALQSALQRRALRPFVAPAVGALGAVALASPLLLAIFHYAPSSVRGAGFKAEGIVQWSLHPLLLAGTVLPKAFGDPASTGPAGFWAAELAGERGQPLFAGFYVGALALAAAVAGASHRSRYRPVALAWLGVLFLLALGKYGPIYPLVGDAYGFDALRYPMKWIVPAMLPLSLLAGLGVDRFGSAADARAWKQCGLILLGALAVCALTCLGVTSGLERTLARLAHAPALTIDGVPLARHVRQTWVGAATRSAIPVALALAVFAAILRGRASLPLAPVIAALVTLDLAAANGVLAPTVAPAFYGVPGAVRAVLDDSAVHGRVYVDQESAKAVRFDGGDAPPPTVAAHAHRDRLIAYVGAGAGLDLAFNDDTEAYSPIAYARAGVLIRSAPLRERLMLLGAAGVGHVTTFDAPGAPLEAPIASVPIGFDRPLRVYRNPRFLPRVRVVPRLTPYDDDAGFIRTVQAAPDDFFRHTALVDRRDLDTAALPIADVAAEGGEATIAADSGASLTVDVTGPGGFLIVSDTLAPGWTARIDGAPAPIIRVDLAFRAVAIPQGSHHVVMHYDPW